MNYYLNNNYTTIKEHGLSFKYPKELQIEKNTTSDKYVGYSIENSKIHGFNRSNISVYIPMKEGFSTQSLSNYIEPEFRSLIKPITLNEHQGEIVTYHLDRQLPGDRPVQAEITKIYLISNYENSPVALTYYRYDADNSIDEAWKVILESLDY